VIEPDSSVDTATYYTGVIMLVLSMVAASVIAYQLSIGTGNLYVAWVTIVLVAAAAYTVADL